MKRFRIKYPGALEPPEICTVTPKVFQASQLMCEDDTGQLCTLYARSETNRVMLGAARNGALCPLFDGTCRYNWKDKRARRTLALSMVIYSCSETTDRVGPWNRLTRGLNRCGLLLAIRDPNGTDPECKQCKHTHPSFSALSGHHRADATPQSGQVGYLVALEEAGALYRQQFKDPATIDAVCQPWEIGEKGYPINWYWFPPAIVHPATVTIVDLARMNALHAVGCDAADESITRRQSYPPRPKQEAQPP